MAQHAETEARMNHVIDSLATDRCRRCKSEYRSKAYMMGSGDIMAVKECDCSLPSIHDVPEELKPEALL
jgi:hypothetical protein